MLGKYDLARIQKSAVRQRRVVGRIELADLRAGRRIRYQHLELSSIQVFHRPMVVKIDDDGFRPAPDSTFGRLSLL